MEQGRLSTRVRVVEPGAEDGPVVLEAGAVLRAGGLVAFPTETVYGLGASALDEQAVAGIFKAKGRPADNPLIVHIDSFASLGQYFPLITERVRLLAAHFWPGPLTLVLKGGDRFPAVVSGGLGTVAVRVPAHPVALALIRAAGVPVAAPSANVSGGPSPTTAAHVLDDLDGRIDLVLDGGPAGLGVESTVLDLSGALPVILRPGGVTPRQLEAVLGPVKLDPAVNGASGDAKPRSPGMKYTHYAPRAPVVLFDGDNRAGIVKRILAEAENMAARGQRVGILTCRDNELMYQGRGYAVIATGWRDDPGSIAAALYESLRCFDRRSVDAILAEGVPAKGLGLAVMNRLLRAAGGNVIKI
ncbi:MAG: L-threonylcarbamoyladenylate synthase [Desulfotomaculaceae bacterium]